MVAGAESRVRGRGAAIWPNLRGRGDVRVCAAARGEAISRRVLLLGASGNANGQGARRT